MSILEILKQEVITCEDYPTLVSDHYVIDFYGKKDNEELGLTPITHVVLPKDIFQKMRTRASSCRRLNEVSAKIKLCRGYNYVELEYKDAVTCVQSKYCKYFAEKYQGCQFYTSAQLEYPIAIRHNNKLVGMVMPLLF